MPQRLGSCHHSLFLLFVFARPAFLPGSGQILPLVPILEGREALASFEVFPCLVLHGLPWDAPGLEPWSQAKCGHTLDLESPVLLPCCRVGGYGAPP